MRFPPKNFPADLERWKAQGFSAPEACEANWRRMYGAREGLMPLVILVWFPIVLVLGKFTQPSIPAIITLVVAMVLTGWSATFRQWHLRRDAEAYLRGDYEAWRAEITKAPECEFLTVWCRIFRHRHPPHQQPAEATLESGDDQGHAIGGGQVVALPIVSHPSQQDLATPASAFDTYLSCRNS